MRALSVDEALLQKLLKSSKSKADLQRVLCVWLRHVFQMSSKEIGSTIGWSPFTVRNIQSRYRKEGPSALVSNGRGGRRRQYLTASEEKTLLKPFVKYARGGRGLNLAGVRASYEHKSGHPVASSTLYRMISRNGYTHLLRKASGKAPRA